ncbi:MAG: ribonuclease III [Clostridia bacterium]|nr:ribonuclease III [Clostridia bacterium]
MTDSPLLLAYLGDAVMEVLVRKHLVSFCKDNAECNRLALDFVTAKRQSDAIRAHLSDLTEEERGLFTRAKNAKSSSCPRNTDLYSYRLATGLEAVFGYNSLLGREERNEELFRLLFLN